MAMPKCPKCENMLFQISEIRPQMFGNATVFVLNCTKCGAAIGVVDEVPEGAQVNKAFI